MNPSNGLQTDPRSKDVRDLLARLRPQFELALPKHVSVDRLLRVALTACQKNPKLYDCTQNSMAAALMAAATVGLEPDGSLGRAYLIPRKNSRAGTYEVNFQPGYQGLLELCYRSGDIQSVRADVVRKGDKINYRKGLDEVLNHVEAIGNFDAEITHVYAIVRTKSGGRFWDIWPAEKVEAHRKRFSKDGRDDSVWNTDWAAMAKKTLLIAVLKYAPKSVTLAHAVEADERGELDLPSSIVVDAPPAPPKKPESVADLRDSEAAGTTLEPEGGSPSLPAATEFDPPPPVSAIPPRRRANKPKEEPPAPQPTAPSLYIEINQLRDVISPELFDAILKKHGGDKSMLGYGLGTDGQRALRDELQKAIG